MQKTTKKLLGLVGLAFVVLLTIFAYLLPTNGVYAEDVPHTAGTDTLRVTVRSQSPSIKINEPKSDYLTTSSIEDVTFTYDDAAYVDFTLTYKDEGGNVLHTALPRFIPDASAFDPDTHTASGTSTSTFNLRNFGLGYNHYILEATSDSGGEGVSGGDSIDFYYVPAILEEVDTEEGTNNPIVEVTYDSGVAKVEVMAVDQNGNPLFDEPVVIYVTPNGDGDYIAGSQNATLPFTLNGLSSGDYKIEITAYRKEDNSYEELYSPRNIYPASYTQPLAPEAPDTGSFLKKLNIAETDYALTAIIVFAIVSIVALRFVHQGKKNYRKNIK